jgi:hypothetical protein
MCEQRSDVYKNVGSAGWIPLLNKLWAIKLTLGS